MNATMELKDFTDGGNHTPPLTLCPTTVGQDCWRGRVFAALRIAAPGRSRGGGRGNSLARKLSLLYVGLSEKRRRAVERSLLAHGYEVDFELASDWDGPQQQQVFRHDFIMVDEMPAAADECEPGVSYRLVVLEGRNPDEAGVVHPVRVHDLNDLPKLLAQLTDKHTNESADASTDFLKREIHGLRQLVAALPGALYRCSGLRNGSTEYVSGQIQALTGHPVTHFLFRSNRRLRSLIHPADRHAVFAAIRQSCLTKQPFTVEHRLLCANGDEKWVWHAGHAEATGPDSAVVIQGFAVDVTDRKSRESRLSFLASHDPLTDLANRTLFMQQVENSIKRAERHHEMVACLFIDIDRFKRVNDVYGHETGDNLLRLVASRLRRCVRGNDVIGRLGGDEFTILVDGISKPLDAAAVASKVIAEISKPFEIESKRLAMSASIGISCYPDDARSSAELLGRADAAMYRMKQTGRHGFQFYSSSLSTQLRENELRARELERAIRNGDFVLRFEPRVDLRSNRAVTLELKLRATGEMSRHLSTRDIVSTAAEAGQIGALYSWLLNALGAQLREWERLGLGPVRIALAAGKDPHTGEDLAELVHDALMHSGFEPGSLVVEFDEGAVLGAPVATAGLLKRLREQGVCTSVAGIGFLQALMEALGDIPVDYLKLDSRIIGDIPDDRNGVMLAGALIGLAKRLKLKIVAQDVQTEAQAVFLRSSECDEAQGPLFSSGLSKGQVERLLQRKLH